MTRIKICGITNLKDALLASDSGADAIGFIFAESPRKIKPELARKIISSLPPFLVKVGVFVDEKIDMVRTVYSYCGLSFVQLHGDEDQNYINALSLPVIKAFKVKDRQILNHISEYRGNYFLLDAFDENHAGGTGKNFDWSISRKAKKFGKVILSGGLNQKNVKLALEKVRPYAVDVCSGVEASPGKKDPKKIRRFINEVREWDYLTN